MSERKRNVQFFRLFFVVAASLLIVSLSSTFLPYSDEESQHIAIRAQQLGLARESRPPEEIFRKLRISRFRLSDHRIGGEMNGTWDTWRLSQGYELVLYGGVHHPGRFFSAEVQYRPDEMFYVRLLIPAVGVAAGAGVIFSLIRWANRHDAPHLRNDLAPHPDGTPESN